MTIFINDFALNCSLGESREEVRGNLFSESPEINKEDFKLIDGESSPSFKVKSELPKIPTEFKEFNSRNNQIILQVLNQMSATIDNAVSEYGNDRIAVIIGTSTSGIDEGVQALTESSTVLPSWYNYKLQEIGNTSQFIKKYLGLESMAYTVSTACSSSARTFLEAKRLLDNDLCDAVIVGGGDSLNALTLNGFYALEALSLKSTNPMSINRDGINIGEGAALFVLSKKESALKFIGAGDSSDAHHISSPDPSGEGAIAAMRKALENGHLSPEDIDYINLHGTGTIKNDQMESLAVHKIFGNEVAASSTKPLTGHTLGAAGGLELAFCCLSLIHNLKPIHFWDNQIDPECASLNLVSKVEEKKMKYVMSNSYAFGGNNISVILGLTS